MLGACNVKEGEGEFYLSLTHSHWSYIVYFCTNNVPEAKHVPPLRFRAPKEPQAPIFSHAFAQLTQAISVIVWWLVCPSRSLLCPSRALAVCRKPQRLAGLEPKALGSTPMRQWRAKPSQSLVRVPKSKQGSCNYFA